MNELALQDRLPHNRCFGCGPHNAGGLNLKSYWTGYGPSVARFTPAPHHCSAPTHFVNGGIIATLIDCHCICTAMAAAYLADKRAIGSDPQCYFATGLLEVVYKRPTPMNTVLELEAEIDEQENSRYRLSCRLSVGGKLCAVGKVLAVPVSAEWMGIVPRA